MSKLTYSQLEGVWIDAGGQRSLAPMMAAIALAESGGQTNALNPSDNNGKQSSFGLWQISTGTHIPPSSTWSDPLTNARLAIGKLKSQGLTAWGTYSSGAYKPYLANGVPPTSVTGGVVTAVSDTGETSNTAACAWNVKLPAVGETCVLSNVQARSLFGGTLLTLGAIVGLIGVALLVAYALGKKPSVPKVSRGGGITNVPQPGSDS